MKLYGTGEPQIAVIIGTGPSLTDEQLDQVKGFRLFGVNNAYQWADLDVHLACNPEWWDRYHSDIAPHRCHKWTWDEVTAIRYGIRHIKGRWAPGISTDPEYIHYHHGSGPQMINLAYHYGARVMILIGWDMRYPGKVSDREYTLPRHRHGEYPAGLQHWPRTGQNGELTGLIAEMETIRPEDYGLQIINCTPGSALKCYPMIPLKCCLEMVRTGFGLRTTQSLP